MPFPAAPDFLSEKNLRPSDLQSTEQALLRCYTWMFLARTTDNRILELFRQGRIKGTVTGGQGNEGLVVPLALLLDKENDVVSWTHRGLGGHLIWSGDLAEHLCQYLANSGSPTKAREGNVHHGDPERRSYPMISHLGAMVSNVAGGTDSQRRKDIPAVGVAFFGDGGSSTGDIHETLNLASLLDIPVLFVIENNHYAYSTPASEQYAGDNLVSRAGGYGIEGISLDATDTLESLNVFAKAIDQVRTSGRPVLIEANTLRLRGHAAYDTCDYLPEGQMEQWEKQDPLPKLRQQLVDAGLESRLKEIETDLKAFLEASLDAAMAFPPPHPNGMVDDVFSPTHVSLEATSNGEKRETLTFAQALQRAHHKLLTERPESLVMGQDIATYGGPFKVTEHLYEKFGRRRVLNTPLAESATVGYAIGLALNGHRPIVEFQFADFATEATTQILLNAGTYHFRSGAKVPVVFRLPCGGGLTFGSFHSQDLEALYIHTPGLKVLYPSTAQDAYNALLAAYEDDNPVLLFEHKRLYRLHKEEVGFDPNYQSIWEPALRRQGTNATVVSYGEMALLAEEAVDYLAEEYEYTCDLFDLRALCPLDLSAIRESLERTHRLVVIHEGRKTGGFGAEIVSRLVEDHFFSLEAPPLRIASADTPVPFAPELESAYRPSRDKIIEAIIAWME